MPATKSTLTTEKENRKLEHLLLRVGGGDREAFAALYARTRGAVYALALSLLRDAGEAQDVSQDVYVRVWESAPGYRSQGSPMAWLLTIARNLALSRLRQANRAEELDEDEWNAIPVPEDSGVAAEDRLLLQEALGALEPEERRIILLHAVSGLKHRETAGLLKLPLSTVLSKYHRGLKKLKKLMEGENNL